MENKKCSTCKKIFTYANFHRNASKKDGYAGECKNCYKTKNYGKILVCNVCNIPFIINHRNIKKRKHLKCKKCINIIRAEKNKTLNKYIIDHGYNREKSGAFQHRVVMENHLNRKLLKHEIIHHIDGNKSNNDINNLWLTNLSDHTKAHKSLENIAISLYKQNKVLFNRDTGRYELIHEQCNKS